MTDHLLTEQPHPDSADLDALSTARLLSLMNLADWEVPEAVGRELPRIARAIEAIAAAPEET